MLMPSSFAFERFGSEIYWMWTIYVGNWCVLSTTMSLSIFLMQHHNSKEYELFLRLLYTSKLYYICCCCKRIFTIEDDIKAVADNLEQQHQNQTQMSGNTRLDTADLSLPTFPKAQSAYKTEPTTTVEQPIMYN